MILPGWHFQTCRQGKTVIDCPGEKVESPKTAFKTAFYPKHFASQESLRWLESEAKQRKIHIHHEMCRHGGERWVEHAWTGTTMQQGLYSNTMDATGTGAKNLSRTIVKKLLTATTKRRKIGTKPQRNVHDT